MKALYIRISTIEQNTARQEKEGFKLFVDKISGSIAFENRPFAKKLIKDIEAGGIKEVHVHSLDRLGRNTLNIMQTIKYFTSKGVNLVSEKEGIQTLVDGKENPMAKLLVGILGTLAEFELQRIKERQAEGIKKAKERGAYINNGGKKAETIEKFLSKPKNKKCKTLLEKGNSIRVSAKLADVSPGTASKISKIIFA